MIIKYCLIIMQYVTQKSRNFSIRSDKSPSNLLLQRQGLMFLCDLERAVWKSPLCRSSLSSSLLQRIWPVNCGEGGRQRRRRKDEKTNTNTKTNTHAHKYKKVHPLSAEENLTSHLQGRGKGGRWVWGGWADLNLISLTQLFEMGERGERRRWDWGAWNNKDKDKEGGQMWRWDWGGWKRKIESCKSWHWHTYCMASSCNMGVQRGREGRGFVESWKQSADLPHFCQTWMDSLDTWFMPPIIIMLWIAVAEYVHSLLILVFYAKLYSHIF